MNIIASFLTLIAIVLSFLACLTLIGWWRGIDNVLFPGLGLVVAMPGLIVLLLILNIGLVIVTAAVKPRTESIRETSSEQKFEYPNDIFGGCGNGVLDLSLAKNPDVYNPDTDYGLKICINDDDLEAISLSIFHLSTRKPYESEENILKSRNENRKLV